MIPKVFLLNKKCKEANAAIKRSSSIEDIEFETKGFQPTIKPKPPDATLPETYTKLFGLPVPPCRTRPPSLELRAVPITGAGGGGLGDGGEGLGDGRGARDGVLTRRGAAASGEEEKQSRQHLERSHPVPFLDIDQKGKEQKKKCSRPKIAK